ncbi:sel1 repeat family protein [Pelomyxa schiedti]|nr:sel1 repeat family protein [Pelomyxa schiedti]
MGGVNEPQQPPPPQREPPEEPHCGTTEGCVVGFDAFHLALRRRRGFFAKLADADAATATANETAQTAASDSHNGTSLSVVGRNFTLVRQLCNGTNELVFEVKCIGEGHPELFRDQSYVLKAMPYQHGAAAPNFLENECTILSKIDPHANIVEYFCHFTDNLPQNYLPPPLKELPTCICVVLQHHQSETLEQFLKNQPVQKTTPWCIVHKFSRDICAAIVHLFNSHTIHFDMTLANIVTSSNRERAILVDLGCAIQFRNDSFERETGCFTGYVSNPTHVAPEILNGIEQYTQNPDQCSLLSSEKQPSFELGCILFELAMCGQHPLPGYPAAYGPRGQISFSFENKDLFPMKPPAFPQEFCNLVRALLQFDPGKRMSLLEASDILSNLEAPSLSELHSFYTCTQPLKPDAGTLTSKAMCQILSGDSTEACADTLHKALEVEPLFSPAMLVLHYLYSSSGGNQLGSITLDKSVIRGICAALAGEASFTSTAVEFMRALINNSHRTTLPELVLSAIWTRHLSHQGSDHQRNMKLLLEKASTSSSIFLRTVIDSCSLQNHYDQMWSEKLTTCAYGQNPRNKKMMEGLFQLENGNIDCALGLVSDAYSMFECPRNGEDSKNLQQEFCYLPALLFLYCVQCVCHIQVDLHQRIPKNLLPIFPRAFSSSIQSLRVYCMSVLSSYKSLASRDKEPGGTDVIEEWSELILAASTDSARQSTPSLENDQTWACLYFVALWETCCSEKGSSASLWNELVSKKPVPRKARTEPIHWLASSICNLGSCYLAGLGGMDRDPSKSVPLFQLASDKNYSRGTYYLANCYYSGTGVARNTVLAFTLYSEAASSADVRAMCTFGVYHAKGVGVPPDINAGVSLFRRAAESGYATAMYYLGICHYNGSGVPKDTAKALALFQQAADSGDPEAVCNLGRCYRFGTTGFAKDVGRAAQLFQWASDAGDLNATVRLGACYLSGSGVAADARRAVQLFQQAADAGSTAALCKLGRCYESGTGVGPGGRDVGRALGLYHQAAAAGCSEAMNILGVRYQMGRGVERDRQRAAELFRRASDAGDAQATRNLGLCYQNAMGVPQDLRRAEALFQKAVESGSEYAKTNLMFLSLFLKCTKWVVTMTDRNGGDEEMQDTAPQQGTSVSITDPPVIEADSSTSSATGTTSAAAAAAPPITTPSPTAACADVADGGVNGLVIMGQVVPPDVLAMIFSMCGVRYLPRVMCVCRHWAAVCTSLSGPLFRMIYEREFGGPLLPQYVHGDVCDWRGAVVFERTCYLDSRSPFCYLISRGHLPGLNFYREHSLNQVSQICLDHHQSPLVCAVRNEDPRILRLLLARFLPTGLIGPIGGNNHPSPIVTAVTEQKYHHARVLLEAGANPNQIDRSGFGRTPLHTACYFGNKEMVELLLQCGADPSRTEYTYRQTAFHIAAGSRSEDVVDILLKGWPELVACADRDGWLPERIARHKGYKSRGDKLERVRRGDA